MAKRRGGFGRRVRRVGRRIGRRFRRHAQAEQGILPTLMGGAAVLVPFVYGPATPPEAANPTVFDAVNAAWQNKDIGELRVAGQNFIGAITSNLGTIAELAGLAIATNWAAKKSGARKATRVNKKWAVF